MKPVVLVILCVTLTPVMKAQWLNYPTPGIPRTADGKPDAVPAATGTRAAEGEGQGVLHRP